MGSYLVVPVTDEDDVRLGMAINGIFGGAVDYNDDWVGRFFTQEVQLTIMNFQPSVAWSLTDWLAVGAGLNIYYASLDKFQLSAPLGGGTFLANGADDWQPTFTVGTLIEPWEGTRLGVNYRYEADLKLTGGKASNFKYAFTLAQGVNVSLFHQLTDSVAIMGDAGWSDWSSFSHQAFSVQGINIDFDRGWRDTWRVASGLQYRVGDWLLQTGVAYDSSPVKASLRTPDLPASEQYRFSAGARANSELRELAPEERAELRQLGYLDPSRSAPQVRGEY